MRKKKLTKKEERMEFIKVYTQLNIWLSNLKFHPAQWNKISPLDFHFSFYDKFIDSLYSVEHYQNDILNIDLFFLRDKNEHKFMFVGELGTCSKVISLTEFKEKILELVIQVKNEKLKDINSIIIP